MFPWEVLITGAVGIGGTSLGAWLNGRIQTKNLQLSIDAENERARLADKRRVYAASQAAYWELRNALNDRRAARYFSQKKKVEAEFRLDKALDSMHQADNELLLIAPDNVTQHATAVFNALRTLLRIDSESGDVKDMTEKAHQIQNDLYKVMRADLGEPD